MRFFDFARKTEDGKKFDEKAFKDAQLPVYKTKHSAGADFFCAETIEIPSVWSIVFDSFKNFFSSKELSIKIAPTLVHTGIKCCMYDDEVLKLYNRSSNPKRGLILANGVGVVDADYYNNDSNDGEIMFAFYNIGFSKVRIDAGDAIGQGVFEKFLRPDKNLIIQEDERKGGFGSTGK